MEHDVDDELDERDAAGKRRRRAKRLRANDEFVVDDKHAAALSAFDAAMAT